MVKKIALEEHFLCPGFDRVLEPDGGRDAGGQARAAVATATPISARCGWRRWTRPASRAPCWRSPDPACRPSATPRPRSATRESGNDFLAKEIQKRPDRYSGFAHLPMQDAKAAADELERCVHGSEVLRRDDQRPHQRAISRPSVAVAVLGARRGARHADLHPSDRSGVGRAGARRAIRGCAAPPGNGPSRPARTRCG